MVIAPPPVYRIAFIDLPIYHYFQLFSWFEKLVLCSSFFCHTRSCCQSSMKIPLNWVESMGAGFDMTGVEFLRHAGVTFIPAENWWLCCPGNLARRKSLGGVTTIRAIWLYSMAPIVWQCYANCYERQSGEILRAWAASETVALLLSNHTSTLLNLPPCTVSLIIEVHGVNCFNSLCLFVWDCVCRAFTKRKERISSV